MIPVSSFLTSLWFLATSKGTVSLRHKWFQTFFKVILAFLNVKINLKILVTIWNKKKNYSFPQMFTKCSQQTRYSYSYWVEGASGAWMIPRVLATWQLREEKISSCTVGWSTLIWNQKCSQVWACEHRCDTAWASHWCSEFGTFWISDSQVRVV